MVMGGGNGGNRPERQPVAWRRPQFRQCIGVLAGAVTLVVFPAIARELIIKPVHDAITGLFGGNGGNRDAEGALIPLHHRGCLHRPDLSEIAERRPQITVNQQMKG